MKKVKFIGKTSNSFGDQILSYFVDGGLQVHRFEEGSWVDPKEFAKILKGEDNGNSSKKGRKRLDSKKKK